MWGADRRSVLRVTVWHHKALPSDAEQLPEVRNFQFAPKNHYGFFFLHTLPSTIAFGLEYVLFYQFYAKITTFFDQEKFGTAPLLYVWQKLKWKWCKDVKNYVKTSKSSYWCHAQESSYTPLVRQHFLAHVCFTEIPVRYARKEFLSQAKILDILIWYARNWYPIYVLTGSSVFLAVLSAGFCLTSDSISAGSGTVLHGIRLAAEGSGMLAGNKKWTAVWQNRFLMIITL